MPSLEKIYTFLFFIGLFFVPFNEFEGLSFLGEYKNESATYFFLAGFVLAVIDSIKKQKISFPYKHPLIIILGLFLLWTFLATLLNLPSVLDNYFKQTSGISRYIRQTISLVISAVCFTFLFWNVIKNYSTQEIVLKVRKVILYSFIFVSVYGFVEIGLVYFGMGFLKPLWDLFEFFPFVNNKLHIYDRVGISSVTYEVPALGNILIFYAPWMFSYILTSKSYLKYLPTISLLILTVLSDARAAFIVVLLQCFCLIVYLLNDPKYKKNIISFFKITTLLVGVLVILNSETIYKTVHEKFDKLNFSKNLTKSISNKSRFGMQYAAVKVYAENPIEGVGFGQGSYHMMHHYPYWATNENWEFNLLYKNQQEKSFPPQFNLYTRLMAETGTIGTLLFLALVSLPLFYSYIYLKRVSSEKKFIGVIFVISFIGFAINWLQIDFFRQYGFWLTLIILIKAIFDFNLKIQTKNLQ